MRVRIPIPDFGAVEHGLQIRQNLKPGEEVTLFILDGKVHMVTGRSKFTYLIPPEDEIPMGAKVTGGVFQYDVQRDDGNRGQAYVYYYRPLEGGWVGIVESVHFCDCPIEEHHGNVL